MKYWLIAFLLISCNPSKRAERIQRNLIEEHPEAVLPIIREAFPVTITQIDTLIEYRDTTIEVECPQGILSPFKAQKSVSYKYVHILQKVEDSGKLKAYTLTIDSLRQELGQNRKYIDEINHYRGKWYWWLLLLIPLFLTLIAKYYVRSS